MIDDYPCPKCGYEGPHAVLGPDEAGQLVECGDTRCAAEFVAAT